jgi:hypothetical protein
MQITVEDGQRRACGGYVTFYESVTLLKVACIFQDLLPSFLDQQVKVYSVSPASQVGIITDDMKSERILLGWNSVA